MIIMKHLNYKLKHIWGVMFLPYFKYVFQWLLHFIQIYNRSIIAIFIINVLIGLLKNWFNYVIHFFIIILNQEIMHKPRNFQKDLHNRLYAIIYISISHSYNTIILQITYSFLLQLNWYYMFFILVRFICLLMINMVIYLFLWKMWFSCSHFNYF